MQVGDTVPVDLQTLANEALRASVGNHIEQHLAGIPDKSVRPARDHAGADEANDGSIQGHPNQSATMRPPMAMTEVSASARTCR
jgi:hypothetical protein